MQECLNIVVIGDESAGKTSYVNKIAGDKGGVVNIDDKTLRIWDESCKNEFGEKIQPDGYIYLINGDEDENAGTMTLDNCVPTIIAVNKCENDNVMQKYATVSTYFISVHRQISLLRPILGLYHRIVK